jgi:hypothetical protein
LREPALAVQYAERIVETSFHHNPEFLLTLAQAYRATGQPVKAQAAAKEGLALLPAETSATVMSRVRKLLHAQAEIASSQRKAITHLEKPPRPMFQDTDTFSDNTKERGD